MTLKLNMKDLFSSDILLHDALVKAQETNEILKEHFISFPDRSKLASEDYGIFVGHGQNDWIDETSNSDTYENLVRIIISNKNSDYRKAKTGIDLATKEIIKVIKQADPPLGNRPFRWIKSQIVYSSQHEIKRRNLDLVFAEAYSWNNDSKYDKKNIKLIYGDVVIDDSDISPEKAQENEVLELIDKIRDLKEQGIDLFPYILSDTF